MSTQTRTRATAVEEHSEPLRWPAMVTALAALLGFFDASYLAIERYIPTGSLVCLTGGGCEAVQNSIYSTFPPGGGIPVAFLGIGGYLLLLLLAVFTLQEIRIFGINPARGLLLVSAVGVVFTVYLTYLQGVVIQQWCSWCLISAGLQLLILLMALLLNRPATRA